MILVVSDDPTLTGMLRVSLERQGYGVENAGDAVTAYKLLKDARCKMMLLDLDLPEINGAELLILMGAENITVPVIVMGKIPDLTEDEMRNFPDVVAYLKRPFHVPDLLDLVQQQIAKRHGRRPKEAAS